MLGVPLAWANTLLGLAVKLTSSKQDKDDLRNAQKSVRFLGNILTTGEKGTIQASAARTLISPMVLFEESLAHQDYMVDLMTIINLRDIRDALTHLSLQGTVGTVKVANLVDTINPNRASGFNALVGAEAFNPGPMALLDKITNSEGTDDDKEDDKDGKKDDKKENKTSGRLSIDPKNNKEALSLSEYVPLALGRVVKASSLIDGQEVSFFLTFRQIPVGASSKEIERMFMAAKKGEDWSARLKEYKAGGITRPELLKGTDVIKREFNIRNNDMSGYYTEAMKREMINKRQSVATGYVSVNQMANTIIISKDTANNIELELGMRFNSPKIKALRKYVNANTIIVVNDERSVVEFFTIGDSIPIKYTFQQIKTKSKNEDTGSLENLIKLLSGR